jgi:hypothetical protein
MNTKRYFSSISRISAFFEPIALEEMNSVTLMDRLDVKYIIPIHQLPVLLLEIQDHYRMLTINDKIFFRYKTHYYDTPDFALYHAHHAGKLNRYKIRTRDYVDSNQKFFEIKFKNNKGRTIKKRISSPYIEDQLDSTAAGLVDCFTPINPDKLKEVIWVDYTRMTLVGKNNPERLTIDLNLTYNNSDQSNQISYPMLVIAEVKLESVSNSMFIDLMKKYRIKKCSISKYCLGITALYQTVKKNRFKQKLLKIHKLISQYDDSPRISNSRPVSVV